MLSRRNRPRQQRRSRISTRPQDPTFTSQKFKVPAFHIPQHIHNPSVKRLVRLTRILTSGAATSIVVYADIANQDGLDYLNVAAARYGSMRVSQIKAWAESPRNLSVSQPTYGLIVTDDSCAYSIQDTPTTGSSLAAVGMRFNFAVRSFLAGTSFSTPIVTFSCTQTIAASTDFVVTADFTVEFYG